MDIKTLESLGINTETLADRIVEQAVEALLSSTGFDPENEVETSYESRFKKEIQNRMQKAVDAKIAALAEVHLVPRVGEMIEKANLQKTNGYGEPKSEPMTFIEYIVSRAESYMSEDVNHEGKSKAEMRDSYGWSSSGPRLTVLMKIYIRQTLETHAKNAIKDINAVVAQNMQKAAIEAIAAASKAMKVSVSA